MGRGPGSNTNTSSNPSNLTPPSSTTSANGLHLTSIADMRPSMRGFNLECILLEKAAEPRRIYDNQLLTTFLAADKTGSIVLIIWGEPAMLLRSGDIVRIQGAEAKLFKGHIQISTSKYGKYKRIGEDTLLFFEKPNWSECEWIQDEHNRGGPMIPINPVTKMPMVPMASNGAQPMLPGGNIQQQRGMQGSSAQPSFNPAFRGDQRPGQRPFPPNQGGNPMAGSGPGPTGFNHKGSFSGGTGGAPANPMQHQQQPMNGSGVNVSPPGPNPGTGGNRSHHGQYQPHSNHTNNQQNQNHSQSHNQKQPAGGSGPSNGHAPNARHVKHSKHNKMHRDLDAPDAYPSPRTGLANSVDEFARDMKLVSQGGVSLGMGPLNHSGGVGGFGGQGNSSLGLGAGSSGPGHMRKKPKVEME
ncbi:Sorting nexin-30 [Dissophora ornata]|nr:Sorting nexin-30 [Dissophora ornata]